MSGRKKHRTANEYLQYLKGNFSNQERHSFERDLESDPFEKEAQEGLEMLTPDQAEEDILSLHTRLRKRLRRRRRIAWYSAAASIASLLIIGTVFLQIYDLNPEVAEETLTEKSIAKEISPEETRTPQEPMKEEIRILEQEAIDEAKPSKEPSKDPAKVVEVQTTETPFAEAPDAKAAIPEAVSEDVEPEMITYVEAEATPQEKDACFDYVVSAPMAAAHPEEEILEEETGRRARRRSERLNQPAVAMPEAMQKKASSQENKNQFISREVCGIVVSEVDMEPLPGATVVLKGSNIGVVTNMDGLFNLPVQDDSNSTLVASFVGMETQEYQFEEGDELQLVMQPDALTLDEVVVVGQGIQPAGVPTGAYSTVKLRDEIPGSLRSAQPSVGYRAFKQYIEDNIQFPEVETTTDRVVVILKFTVTSAGEINNIIPLRSLGEPFTQEAIRLIIEGPSWNPATDDNGNIEEIVRIRIVFKK